MLTIRFSRVGKKNKAQFKIMLQEQSFAPGGKHVEILGSYDPHKKIAVLKEERIKYWLSKGVKASDTVHNLLVSKNVISDKKRAVKIPKKIEDAKAEETKAEDKKPEEKKELEVDEAKKEEKMEQKEETKEESK
jgi:small subunit ribosomal protein S16